MGSAWDKDRDLLWLNSLSSQSPSALPDQALNINPITYFCLSLVYSAYYGFWSSCYHEVQRFKNSHGLYSPSSLHLSLLALLESTFTLIPSLLFHLTLHLNIHCIYRAIILSRDCHYPQIPDGLVPDLKNCILICFLWLSLIYNFYLLYTLV